MAIRFRNKRGQFVGKGYTGVTFYKDASGRVQKTRGLSAKKFTDIKLKRRISPTEKAFKLSDILRVAEKADSVSFTDQDGKSIDVGFSGKVKATYRKGKKVIEEFEFKGLSKDKFSVIQPRGIVKGKVISFTLRREDGETFWEALQNKKISVRHLKRIRVTVNFSGENLRLDMDLTDKDNPKWSKAYTLAYRIRNALLARGFRFSPKRKVKGKAAKKQSLTKVIHITIQQL